MRLKLSAAAGVENRCWSNVGRLSEGLIARLAARIRMLRYRNARHGQAEALIALRAVWHMLVDRPTVGKGRLNGLQ